MLAHGSEDDEQLTVGSLEALAEKAKRNAPHLASRKETEMISAGSQAVGGGSCGGSSGYDTYDDDHPLMTMQPGEVGKVKIMSTLYKTK